MEFDIPEQTAQKSPEKDSDDDSSTKKKRAGRASVRLAESKADRENRRPKEEPEQPKTPLELFKAPLKEVKTASKEEVPDEEKVAEEEKPLAISALSAEEAEAIPEHSSGEEITPAIAGDVAAKEMLEDMAATGEIEGAASRAAAKVGASAEEVADEEKKIDEEVSGGADAHAESEDESEAEPEAEEEIEAEQVEPVEEVVFDRSAEQDTEEADPAAPTGGTAGTPPPPPAVPPPAPPGGSPPRGPLPPFGAGGPAGGAFGGPGGHAPIPTLSGNLYHTPITPDSPAVERYDQGNPAVTALIGGIIGYFIGRRRGRIKTEKKLLPIQKKLEKQVEDMHWEIKRKELAIRRVAARKVQQNGALVIEKVVSRRAEAKAKQPNKPSLPERRVAERRPAPEAHQLHASAKAHEHLGHMLVTAEAATRREKAAERPLPKPESQKATEQIPSYLRERNMETLNRADLLAISEKIIVDGTSLRQIYETHLIGERGLRRLVAEHLHGGDVKKILRQEIIEHEIDFERDPVLRDLPSHATVPKVSSSTMPSKATLDKLVEQASAGIGGESDALAYYKARAAYEAHEQQGQKSQRRLADIGLVVTIVVLTAVIIILFLMRH